MNRLKKVGYGWTKQGDHKKPYCSLIINENIKQGEIVIAFKNDMAKNEKNDPEWILFKEETRLSALIRNIKYFFNTDIKKLLDKRS